MRLKLIATLALAGLAFGLEPRVHMHRVSAESGADGKPPVGWIYAQGYFPDKTPTAFRSGVGIADSTNIATVTSSYPASGTAAMADYQIGGRPNLDLEAVFTVSGTTCVVTPLWEYESAPGTLNFCRWGTPVTLTASSLAGPSYTGAVVTGGTGYATSPGALIDSGGATHVRWVVTTAPSQGTVALYPVSF